MERKNLFTKQDLLDAGIKLIPNENEVGGWEVYQYRVDNRSTWKTRRPIINFCTKHPYGKDKYYPGVGFRLFGKPKVTTLHQLVWIYNYDNYPEGYDICHKDDDPYNCQLDNLEIKPHIDNIRERKFKGPNQYYNTTKPRSEKTENE